MVPKPWVAKGQNGVGTQKGIGSAQKDRLGNFLVDESGRVKTQDYIEETIIYQKGKIRLNLSKIAYELQEYFWFSTISILMNCKFENDCFKESYLLTLIPEENTFLITPQSRVDVSKMKDIQLSANDSCNLIKIIESLSTNSRLRIAVGEKPDSKERPNKITKAGQWKNASDFQESELGISNCIYYLASENSENGPARMYIGEATVSGKRLYTKKVNGITYIGHRERPWEFSDYKFTRYRIDEVSTWDAMHDAQDAMIGSFFMSNYKEFPNGFVLTNNAFNKAYSSAIRIKESRKNDTD